MLTVSGVSDVDSFDESTIIVFTDSGELTIKGEELHIKNLDIEAVYKNGVPVFENGKKVCEYTYDDCFNLTKVENQFSEINYEYDKTGKLDWWLVKSPYFEERAQLCLG